MNNKGLSLIEVMLLMGVACLVLAGIASLSVTKKLKYSAECNNEAVNNVAYCSANDGSTYIRLDNGDIIKGQSCICYIKKSEGL